MRSALVFMQDQVDSDAWLVQYYSKIGHEIQFSRARRDTVTNWGLTLFLAILAAYTASLTTQSALPVFWRIGIIAAGLALSVRFFIQGMISYAFFQRWRLLEREIESHWMNGTVSVQSIKDDVQKYEHGKRVPVTKWNMAWSQLRAGFLLNLSALWILLIVEVFRAGALGWEGELILTGFAGYLLWEFIIFLTYDQLKKPGSTGRALNLTRVTAVTTTLRNVKWQFVLYAIVYVIVLQGTGFLLADSSSIKYVILAGLVWFGIGIAIARKRKQWFKRFTSMLTWFAIIFGSITAGQLSRITLGLAQFLRYGWLVWVGVGMFIVEIAMVFWFVDIFRSGAFVAEVAEEKS